MKFLVLLFFMMMVSTGNAQQSSEISVAPSDSYQINGADIQNIFFTQDKVMGWKRDGAIVTIFPISLAGITTAIVMHSNGNIEYLNFIIGQRRDGTNLNHSKTYFGTVGGVLSYSSPNLSQSYYANLGVNIGKEESAGLNLRYTTNDYRSSFDGYYGYYRNGYHLLGIGNIGSSNVFASFQGSLLIGAEYYYRPSNGRTINLYIGEESLQKKYREEGVTIYQPITSTMRVGYSLTHSQDLSTGANAYVNSLDFNDSNVLELFTYDGSISNRDNLYMFSNRVYYSPKINTTDYTLRQVGFSALNVPTGTFGSYYEYLGSKNDYDISANFSNQTQEQILQNDLDRIEGLFNTGVDYSLQNDLFLEQHVLSVNNQYNFAKINTALNGSYSWNTDDTPSYRRYTLAPEIGVIAFGDRIKGWYIFNRNTFSLNETDVYSQQSKSNQIGLTRYYYSVAVSGYVGQGSSYSGDSSNDSQLYGARASYHKGKYALTSTYDVEKGQLGTETDRAEVALLRTDKSFSMSARLRYSENKSSVYNSSFVTAILSAAYSFESGKKPLRDIWNEKPVVINAEFFIDNNFNGVQDEGEPLYNGPLEIDMGSAKKSYDLKSGLLTINDIEDRPYFFVLPKGYVSSSGKYVSPGPMKKIGIYKAVSRKIQVHEASDLRNDYPLVAKCGAYNLSNFNVEKDYILFDQPEGVNCEFSIDLSRISVPLTVKSTSVDSSGTTQIEVERISPTIYGRITGKLPKSVEIESNQIKLTKNTFQYVLKNYHEGIIDIKLPNNCQIDGNSNINYSDVNPTYVLNILCK